MNTKSLVTKACSTATLVLYTHGKPVNTVSIFKRHTVTTVQKRKSINRYSTETKINQYRIE